MQWDVNESKIEEFKKTPLGFSKSLVYETTKIVGSTQTKNEQRIKPKIKVGSHLEVKGYFDNPINGSSRKSFTATSYTLLACPHSQKKPYHCATDCECLKGKDLRAKEVLNHSQARFPYWEQRVKEYCQRVDYLTKQQELEKIRSND